MEKTVRSLVLEKSLLDAQVLEEILGPYGMTEALKSNRTKGKLAI